MRSMKEILAKRDRKIWIYALILILLVALSMGNFIKTFINTDMRWLVIVMVILVSASFLSALWGLIGLPDYVIVKEDGNLIIYNGIIKQTLPIKDILSAELPKNNTPLYQGLDRIVLRVNTEKGEKNIHVCYIKNPQSVVDTINQLLHTSV